jgi:hypothetical protein
LYRQRWHGIKRFVGKVSPCLQIRHANDLVVEDIEVDATELESSKSTGRDD